MDNQKKYVSVTKTVIEAVLPRLVESMDGLGKLGDQIFRLSSRDDTEAFRLLGNIRMAEEYIRKALTKLDQASI